MNTTTRTENNALTVSPRQQFDLSPQTFDQAITFSGYLADSDLVPKDFKGKPGNCLIAMQWGAELGLKPLQAIQNIAIINGRPALWGDAVIALVRSSPACEYVIEESDGKTAICKVKRRGEPEQFRSYSMDDAKQAGLLGKQGPWSQYPKRMLQLRARAFALRDVFPDVLRGMPVAEEVRDEPTEKFMGPVDEVTSAPTPAPQLDPYPTADFEKNLPAWHQAIAAGRASADQIIGRAKTKYSLSPDQENLIRNRPAPAATADAEEPAWATAEEIEKRMNAATDMDQLNDAAALIDGASSAAREHLEALYESRLAALN
ncbi:recombinase RecT [Diaphorobacter caeni]|uniref:recombinase RecT n=1 Tax=Diaphorobacter caeni TaxID=2784387 RepID=UPI00188FC4FC|nr:recombinase RecT [Diaphorobacter caeni]MBF5006886.1 recombinase RecT [Diaphorobacter caeni]